MKDIINRYKSQFAVIPEPLQKQVFIRLGFALVFLLLFILVLCMHFDWLTVVPFIGLSAFSVYSAVGLVHRASTGDYVVVRGLCVESVVTPIRKRTKSILVQTDEHIVQVMMKQRLKRIAKGAALEIYIANNTPVYDKDGAKLLHTYLAIDTKGGQGKNDKGRRSVHETEDPRGTHSEE